MLRTEIKWMLQCVHNEHALGIKRAAGTRQSSKHQAVQQAPATPEPTHLAARVAANEIEIRPELAVWQDQRPNGRRCHQPPAAPLMLLLVLLFLHLGTGLGQRQRQRSRLPQQLPAADGAPNRRH